MIKRIYYSNYYTWLVITVALLLPVALLVIVLIDFIMYPIASSLREVSDQYKRLRNIEFSLSKNNFIAKRRSHMTEEYWK